jgi:hypothetical protein
MKYRLLMLFVFVFAGMTVIAQVTDINGEWIVDISGSKTDKIKTHFEFETHGSTLTGSMLGYPDLETPILDGKINGDKISFTIKEYRRRDTISYLYNGKISGDVITFDVVALVGVGIPPHKKYIAKRVVPEENLKK